MAGVDNPRNRQEFDRWFFEEASCRDYVLRIRWEDGYRCPRCGSKSPPWVTSRGYRHCSDCGSEIPITSGTTFELSRKLLGVWFQAMWFLTNQKHGVSAVGIQRELGLGSYQTAWSWLHKPRRAMVRTSSNGLNGHGFTHDRTVLSDSGDPAHVAMPGCIGLQRC